MESPVTVVISSDEESSSTILTPSSILFTPSKNSLKDPDSPVENFSESASDEDSDFMPDKLPSCRKKLFDDTGTVCEFFKGDCTLPIYSRTTTGYDVVQLVDMLLSDTVPGTKICSTRPRGVSENATFIIDVDTVDFSDLKSDDMGSWATKGTKSTYFTRHSDQSIEIHVKKPAKGGVFCLTRRYYVHGTYKLFRRVIVDVCNSKGVRNKFALVQYIFEGSPVKVLVKPHGNSKGKSSYYRTSASAMRNMKTVASTMPPKEAVSSLTKQEGGELKLNPGDVPRDRQQISNMRRTSQSKSPDVLYSVMLQCKLAEGTSNSFVRDVKAAPSPQSVLFFDWQLDDMVRFLTNNSIFGVLTVDTTFNLGAFYVTPMTYPHLMLTDVKSGGHPILVGPLLVHQQTNFASFNYFCSTLIGFDKHLRHVMAFGTDGDTSLVESLSHAFPFAIQLRCIIHFKRNLQEKLKSSGYPTHVIAQFIEDILGNSSGGKHVNGLIDTTSEDEFDSHVADLEMRWKERDEEYHASGEPFFYAYFCKYYFNVLKYHMRRDVRESAGLGCPPALFTTNAAEAINSSLKRKVNFKESEWPDFIQSMKDLVDSQRQEVIRALSNRGQYRLLPEYHHLSVSVQDWTSMTVKQRTKIIDSFNKAVLITGDSPCTEEPLNSTPSTSGAANTLAILPEDSGIVTLPIITLQGMWKKANQLLSVDNAITKAPGSDAKAKMVISFSSSVPHMVKSGYNGKYSCDSNCLQWSSSHICSHCLAVAQTNNDLANFLDWYVRSNLAPNLTRVGMQGAPSGRGRKGGKSKRKKTTKAVTEENIWNVQRQPSVSATQIAPSSVHVTQSIVQSTPPALPTSSSGPHPPSQIQSSLPSQIQHPSGIQSPLGFQTSTASWHTPPVGPSSWYGSTNTNTNPFYFKFIVGNIRICQGCRQSLRNSDNSIPMPPYDLAVARAEKRSFRDNEGNLITPLRETVCHYHSWPACILAVEPYYTLSTVKIPCDVERKMLPIHKDFIRQYFGIVLPSQ